MEVLIFLWVAIGTMLIIAGMFDLLNPSSSDEDKRLGKYAIITGLFLPVVFVATIGLFLIYIVRTSLRV